MTEPTSNGADRHFGFGTRAIHAGAQPDPVTGARATPIHQTTSFVFDNAEHAGSLFNLQTFGNVYSRISNPTVAVFEERIASLENGRAARIQVGEDTAGKAGRTTFKGVRLDIVLTDSMPVAAVSTRPVASAWAITPASWALMVTRKASSPSSNWRRSFCCTTSTPITRPWWMIGAPRKEA